MAKVFEKDKLQEINLLFDTLKNVHWLKNNIHWEANFAKYKGEKKNDELLKQIMEKLVVELFKKLQKENIK